MTIGSIPGSSAGSRVRESWASLAPRERTMLAVMALAIAAFVLWLGIVPRTTLGLRGVLFAPFLHGSLAHLLASGFNIGGDYRRVGIGVAAVLQEQQGVEEALLRVAVDTPNDIAPVSKAVNEAVVLSFAAIWVLNFVVNLTMLGLFPDMLINR
mgnify:CR=1 FL=1